MKSSSHKKFLLVFPAFTVLFLCAIAAFNAVVDPFYVFNIATIRGVNEPRTRVTEYMRVALAYRVRRVRPRTLVMGSSRAMRRTFCEHSAMRAGAPCLNVPIFACTAYENLRYFEHAQRIRPLRRVVWGLDFFAFNSHRPATMPGFREDRLAVRPDGRPAPYPLSDMLSILISRDTLRESVRTILGRDTAVRHKLLSDAFPIFNAPEPANPIDSFDRNDVIFQAAGIATTGYLIRPECDYLVGNEKNALMMRSFKRFLDTATCDGIEAHLFIAPVHVYLEETKYYLGVWDEYEQWKREITRLTADARQKGARVTLWDFSGYNSITTEPLPPGDRAQPMKYYFEVSHYRNNVATMIMDTMFGIHTPGTRTPHDFGVVLTPQNIDARLKHIRARRIEYKNSHQAELESFKNILIRKVEQTLKSECRTNWRENIGK